MRDKVLLAWSGGKDSALALYELSRDQGVEVVALLTTVTEGENRVAMHSVRCELLEQQAESIGLPLEKVFVPWMPDNSLYEQRMRQALEQQKARGVSAVAFGDIFLDDLRQYREEKLALVGLKGLFPLWKQDTKELAQTFIDLGFRAVISCADAQAGCAALAGRQYDAELLDELPDTADWCFENGECHSFVYDGPIFRWPIEVATGDIRVRDERFYQCDLVSVEQERAHAPVS